MGSLMIEKYLQAWGKMKWREHGGRNVLHFRRVNLEECDIDDQIYLVINRVIMGLQCVDFAQVDMMSENARKKAIRCNDLYRLAMCKYVYDIDISVISKMMAKGKCSIYKDLDKLATHVDNMIGIEQDTREMRSYS